MTSVTQVVKSVGPKLVPFLKTVAIYFVLFIPYDKPSIFSTIIKCLPIISLMLFVLLHGMNNDNENYKKYSRRILIGLIFCCIGDGLLIWPNYFEFGILCFALGHIHYILAFQFKPLNLPLSAILYGLGGVALFYLMPGVHGAVLTWGIIIYTMILSTMVWRATARVQFFEDLWTWSKLCTCAGGMLFALSDLIIGIEKFLYRVDYAQALIMSTYYAAQLGIALSVVDATAAQRQQQQQQIK